MELYVWALEKLDVFLAHPQVEEITKRDLEKFMISCQGLSGSSQSNIWKTLRSFFTWYDDEYHTGRPEKDLKRPKYTADPIRPLSIDEVRNLLDACKYTKRYATTKRKAFRRARPTAVRDTAMIITLTDTGLRIGELCRLRIEDIDLKSNRIRVKPFGSGQKTKARDVPIGASSKGALWKYIQERVQQDHARPNDFLFMSEKDNPLNRHSANHLLQRLGELSGVENPHPHRFRHTFATEYLRNGGRIETLAAILGHSTVRMALLYAEIVNADLDRAHQLASPADHWRL